MQEQKGLWVYLWKKWPLSSVEKCSTLFLKGTRKMGFHQQIEEEFEDYLNEFVINFKEPPTTILENSTVPEIDKYQQ